MTSFRDGPAFVFSEKPISIDDIRSHASGSNVFSLSHEPQGDDAASWAELLFSGLTFDILGLGQEAREDIPDFTHGFDFEPEAAKSLHAVALRAGPHLEGGSNMVPVVRGMMALLQELALLPGVKAIGWSPAASVMSVQYFDDMVGSWLTGGAFPALGLTALATDGAGSTRSEGLSFFTGQELEFALSKDIEPIEKARLAVRLIDALIERPRLEREWTIEGPDGGLYLLRPDASRNTISILN